MQNDLSETKAMKLRALYHLEQDEAFSLICDEVTNFACKNINTETYYYRSLSGELGITTDSESEAVFSRLLEGWHIWWLHGEKSAAALQGKLNYGIEIRISSFPKGILICKPDSYLGDCFNEANSFREKEKLKNLKMKYGLPVTMSRSPLLLNIIDSNELIQLSALLEILNHCQSVMIFRHNSLGYFAHLISLNFSTHHEHILKLCREYGVTIKKILSVAELPPW
jgi:hypothetical protein